MSMTASAPMRCASASRAAGPPMTMTWVAPESCARMAALSPTGPLPCTTTLSPSMISARSRACTAVGRPQPAPIKRSGGTLSGSGSTLTPGLR